MPTETSPPARDRWCDIDGHHVALLSWVEQVAEDSAALFSGLHHRGEVIGRGRDVVYVRFEGKGQLVCVSPRLVRLLPGLQVTLLVPGHALTPRIDQPARPEHNEGPAS